MWPDSHQLILVTEIRNTAHAADKTVVQCEVIYFMEMHNILVYTGLLAQGMAADTGCATARGGVFQPWNTPSLALFNFFSH